MTRLPKSIIKKYGITKKAWAVFRGRSGSKSSRKARHNPKGGKTRKMARKKGRRGGHRSRKIPLAPIGGLVYGLTNGVLGGSVVYDVQNGNYENALKQLSTGLGFNAFSGKFDLANAKILHGVIGGGLIHIAASKLGVNRAIAKVPLVNI